MNHVNFGMKGIKRVMLYSSLDASPIRMTLINALQNKLFLQCRFSSSITSPLSWISPVQYLKSNSPKPDPPLESVTMLQNDATPTKRKFISHEAAVNLIDRQKDPQRALEVFNEVSEQKGFNHNHATYSALLHKLAQLKKFNTVDAVLQQMKYEPCKFEEGIFILLMKRFSRCSLHHKVLEMFHLIQPIAREKPSLKAVSTCLNLLVEADQMHLVREFLLNAKELVDLKPNTCIFNILVKHHCKNGDLESAFEVVEEMKRLRNSYPNLITYSTLMGGLCEKGRLEEAFLLFEEMISNSQILPDALTYNILINGFCRAGKTNQAKKILEFMKKNGCNPNLHNYSTLINGFGKEGRIQEAKEVFDEIRSFDLKPDKVAYTSLINCFCKADQIEEAVKLLEVMKTERCNPDSVTYNAVVGGLCREKRFEEAIEMIERLPLTGVFLNKSSYRIVLNFLSEHDEMEKASKLLKLMIRRGFVPHYATSNMILVQLCAAGKGSDAALALTELLYIGFVPEVNSWTVLLEMVCRERRLLPVFELLDKLTLTD